MRIIKIYVILLMPVLFFTACGDENLTAIPIPTAILSPRIETQTPILVVSTATTETKDISCSPTIDDGLSPSYKPNSPIRSSVGSGHVLIGIVRSSADCAPITGAKIELWPEYADQGHPDEARATIFTDENGNYRFECDAPEHIHMRISAAGYLSIAQNSYHPDGQAEGRFDIVLVPERK